jgi:uncharacterized FAD-dependent dehydrogenase
MQKKIELVLPPEEAFDDSLFEQAVKTAVQDNGSGFLPKILKRSIDARSKKIVVRVQLELMDAGEPQKAAYHFDYQDVSKKREVIVVGAGPAGLFAALRLIELGLRPIVIERGKDVQARRRDLAAINKDQIVNPESNYCFGEGGAGTYSDGKLYTRSTKRGDVNRILEILIAHGAKTDIRFDAHPHIGTNKLPKIVEQLRETIRKAGGEVLFEKKVTDFLIDHGRISGVEVSTGETIKSSSVILSTGHSARDIFYLLHQRGVRIEAKPFALGVRVEHAQSLIDEIQYHCVGPRNSFLPASSYSLVHQAKVKGTERGVFSFCMCPGGFIVPSATSPGEIVVNGMSPSRRDSKFSNSGIVVAVGEKDFMVTEQNPLAALEFQKSVEQRACQVAGGTQVAPAQRLMDFLDNKTSSTLLETSYQPGLQSTAMRDVLPDFIHESLKQGFREFGKKMKGYLTNEAQIIGVESRTSSPVRIPRDAETLQHVEIEGLFPCGEGAGYAGGIVSAAMDGERCAESVAKFMLEK